MKKLALAIAAISLPLASSAFAQAAHYVGANQDGATTVIIPNVVPGAKIKSFAQFDMNNDGEFLPIEFAQAMMFLTTPIGAAGGPDLPAADRYMHVGSPDRMRSDEAVELLNSTALALAAVDTNGDWRVSKAELAAAALM